MSKSRASILNIYIVTTYHSLTIPVSEGQCVGVWRYRHALFVPSEEVSRYPKTSAACITRLDLEAGENWVFLTRHRNGSQSLYCLFFLSCW